MRGWMLQVLLLALLLSTAASHDDEDGPTVPTTQQLTSLSVGCYAAKKPDSVLKIFALQDTQMTIELCGRTCEQKQFRYYGVRAGSVCLCGSSITNGALKVESQRCEWRCLGNVKQLCGSDQAVQVFNFNDPDMRLTANDSSSSKIAKSYRFSPSEELMFSKLKRVKLQTCNQSSSSHGYSCNLAIDGDTNPEPIKGGSCSDTEQGDYNWWSAKTEYPASIRAIRLYNRNDDYAENLNDFDIFIDGVLCASYNSTDVIGAKTLKCEGVGQEVKIQLNTKATYLSLCEVEVFEEPSLELFDCKQSSDHHNTTKCELAMDQSAKTCSDTLHQVGNWWIGNALWPAYIRYIRIHNRADGFRNELNNFDIYIDGVKQFSYDNSITFKAKMFEVGIVGKSFKLAFRDAKKYLSICDFRVFGDEMRKLSGCQQSSVVQSCSRAIDRNKKQDGSSCSDTLLGEKNWWSASTRKPMFIRAVRIFNRADAYASDLKNFEILVDDKRCASDSSGEVFSIKLIKCEAYGQVIKIALQTGASSLSLCEVEVYGTYL